LRKIIIGFSTPKKPRFTSWLIRLFGKTPYSHVYMRLETMSKSPLPFDKVFQASHGDVNAITYDVFKDQNKIFNEYEIEMNDDKYFSIYKWLWFQLGKPYGFAQLISIALNLKITSNKGNKFICTELAGMVLRDHLGYDINESLDYISLKDIKKILEAKK